ncbi:hypothetical protein CXF85_16980 [Colwellia sp. 75C3]|nr:hypothetical protein CXF85_16980 [Colwellia sp. 75C3]
MLLSSSSNMGLGNAFVNDKSLFFWLTFLDSGADDSVKEGIVSALDIICTDNKLQASETENRVRRDVTEKEDVLAITIIGSY